MKSCVSLVSFVFCILIVTGCNNSDQRVQGPDGKFYRELPKARNYEEHCQGAGVFSMVIASRRSGLEIRDGEPFIVENSKEAIREDLDNELEGYATFTEEGKRNYAKIIELFNRIIMTDEFKGRTPEDVRKEIYEECTFKMVHGTWFIKPPSP